MKKSCAFCGKRKRLTREHVFPKSIIERVYLPIRYSVKARKTFAADLVIRDVCADCNNGPLSQLDHYGIKLFETYFSNLVEAGQRVVLEYDFSRLMNWLIKISYNSARMAKGTESFRDDSNLLSLYAPGLISNWDCSPCHVGVFVATVGSSEKLILDGDDHQMQPRWLRASQIMIPALSYHDWGLVRMVLINSYAFFLLFMKRPFVAADDMTALISQLRATPLTPLGQTIITAPTFTVNEILPSGWP